MATAYNLRGKLDLAARAKLQELSDPGSGGTVSVANKDLTVLRLSGSGARTLQAAAQVPVGTRLIVVSDTDGATVNSVTVNDGDAVEFLVGVDAAGANTWVGRNFSAVELTAVEVPATASVDAQDVVDLIFSILDDLEAAGILDRTGITQAS